MYPVEARVYVFKLFIGYEQVCMCMRISHRDSGGIEGYSNLPVIVLNFAVTVFDLISEHTLISGHPPILRWWRLLPEHVEIYVYWLCYCVASCNRYLMLINHPTDGATRGLTLRSNFKITN